MKVIELTKNKIIYDGSELELRTVTIEKLEFIVDEVINEKLEINIEEEQTSPNAIFLKSLKREIDEDFIKEIKNLEQEVEVKQKEIETLEIKNKILGSV